MWHFQPKDNQYDTPTMEPDKTTTIGVEIHNMSFKEKQRLAQEMASKQDFLSA